MSIGSNETLSKIVRTCGILAIATAWFLLTVLRFAAFYPLLWLRMLVLPITNFVAVMCMIGLCIAALIHPDPTLLWRLGMFSFGAFMTGWLYDSLLLWLSPEAIILDSHVD